jgi:hypothetical protein
MVQASDTHDQKTSGSTKFDLEKLRDEVFSPINAVMDEIYMAKFDSYLSNWRPGRWHNEPMEIEPIEWWTQHSLNVVKNVWDTEIFRKARIPLENLGMTQDEEYVESIFLTYAGPVHIPSEMCKEILCAKGKQDYDNMTLSKWYPYVENKYNWTLPQKQLHVGVKMMQLLDDPLKSLKKYTDEELHSAGKSDERGILLIGGFLDVLSKQFQKLYRYMATPMYTFLQKTCQGTFVLHFLRGYD